MADGQIAQLLLQVDANVAVAQRSLQDLARTVQQSSGQMNAALATNDNAITNTMSQHHKLGLAYNNSLIAQRELTAAVTRSVDAYGAGASPLRILQTEIGRLSEAAMFLGGGAGNGILGTVTRFLGGPWGIALLVAGSIIAKVVSAHKDEAESLDTAYDKLKKSKEQTELNARADDIWAHSIDGVIDSEKKLADQLESSLKIQSVAQQQALTTAQARVALRSGQLDQAQATFNEGDPRLAKYQDAFHQAVRDLNLLQTQVSEEQGAALADLTKAADLWADKQQDIMRTLLGLHPELKAFADQFSAAFEQAKKAAADAAGEGINVNPMIAQINGLNEKLRESPTFAQQYIADLKKIAAEMEAFVEKAKNAPKAIEDFKKSLIGAEGTGPNQLGSSAAGFGQFMPKTFESYFKRLYPDQASGLTNAQIDDFRNKREVATAIISAATDDYVKVLKAAGQQITAASLYTVHLLGAPDARKLFAASPDTPTSSFLSGKVLAGNPFLRGTAADARAAIATRIGDSSGPVSSGAAAIQQALKEQADKEAAAQADFQKQSDQLNTQILKAKASLLGDYEARAPVLMAEVDAEKKQLDDAIDAKAKAQKLAGIDAQIVDARAAMLHQQVKDLADAKKTSIGLKSYGQWLDDRQRVADQEHKLQLGDLHFADEMAKSQAAHRRLQLQIIDITYQQKEADLRTLLAKQKAAALAGDLVAAQQALLTEEQLKHLPTEKAQDQARVNRGTMGPLESYNSELPHQLDTVKQRLEEIQVIALKRLNDDLVSATVKALGLKGALGDVVGELLKLSLDVAEGAILSALHIPARAGGGPVSMNQAYIVGEKGPELFVPGTSGMILPNVPRISVPQGIGAGANDNSGGVTVYQTIAPNFAGNAATHEDLAHMAVLTKTATLQAVREERRRATG